MHSLHSAGSRIRSIASHTPFPSIHPMPHTTHSVYPHSSSVAIQVKFSIDSLPYVPTRCYIGAHSHIHTHTHGRHVVVVYRSRKIVDLDSLSMRMCGICVDTIVMFSIVCRIDTRYGRTDGQIHHRTITIHCEITLRIRFSIYFRYWNRTKLSNRRLPPLRFR